MTSQTIKAHCLQVYTYITLAAEEAQKEMSVIDGEIQPETIMNRLSATLDFSNRIVQQLTRYMEDIQTDIKELEQVKVPEINNGKTKKVIPLKRSKLSLKKEKDPEYTQDEFLEIYKIDMTEDLNVPFPDVGSLNISISTPDKSDNDTQSLISGDNLITSNIDIDRDAILNRIGCDSSDIDSDSGHSIFSTETIILETKKGKQSQNNNNDDDKKGSDDQNTASDDNVSVPDVNNSQLTVKECSVVLSDCESEERHTVKQRDDENEDKEMRDIENLINLDNLNRKRKLDQDDVTPNESKKHKRKSTKLKSASDLSDSDSSDFNTDSDSQSPTLLAEDISFPIPRQEVKVARSDVDLMRLLLECISDASDLIEDTDDDSDSSTDIDKNHNKKKTQDKTVEQSEIAEIQEEKNDARDLDNADDLLQISNIEIEEPKKNKWRKDKLLTEKLTDGSTDDEKENDPELRRKPRRKRKLRKKSITDDVKSHRIVSSSSEIDTKSDSEFDNLSVEILSFSSDSASDIEFVKAFPTKSEEDENESGKVGRRNIRTVQSDALLTETTKKAQKEEEERRERLLSQTQLFELSDVTEVEGLILDIDKETKTPLITVDKNITNRLKDHQKAGVRFMWNSCYENVDSLKKPGSGTGCILAHCMGLGKSFQVTALINTLFAHEITNTQHVLIICPLSTVLNWENEFNICAQISDNKVKIDRFLITDGKTKQQRHRVVIDWYKRKGVLIVGYDSFQSLLKTSENSNVSSVPKKVIEALLDPGPDLVICDEGHLIKNGNLNRAKALAKIKTKRRIILTGTPMQNNLTEYYYMVDFVKPNLLGTKTEFSNRFINPIVNGGYDNSTEDDIKLMRKRSHVLHDYLKDTIQRYEISELEQYLPDKLDYVIFIQLSPLQSELYKTCLELVSNSSSERKGYLQDYMKLRNIWTHPGILKLKEQNKALHQNKRKEVDTIGVEPEIQEDPGEWWLSKSPDDVLTNIEHGPKMKVMLEIIKHSIRLDDKVIIFGSHLAELDMIECFLQENGWKKNASYLRMDGTVPPDARMACCNKFNYNKDNQIKIFLVSHQVGGLGLNLIAANRIILMDVNFNPAHDTQSIFRAYRFGQEKRCHVYRLVSIGTMEEVIYERSVTKLAVSLRVVDEHQISRHYKSNDLQKMYRFKIYTDEERPIVKLPADEVLASILEKCKSQIFKYHMHQDLLENRLEEQLNADEQRLAWAEFRQEQEAGYQAQIAMHNMRQQNLQNTPSNSMSTSTTTLTTSITATSTSTASITSTLQQNQHEEIHPEIIFVNRIRPRAANIQNFRPPSLLRLPVSTISTITKPVSTITQQSQAAPTQILLPRNTTIVAQQPNLLNASDCLKNIAKNMVTTTIAKMPPTINAIRGANITNFGQSSSIYRGPNPGAVKPHPQSILIPGLTITATPTVTAPVVTQSNPVITTARKLAKNASYVNSKPPNFVTTNGMAIIPSTSGVTVSHHPTRKTSLSSIKDGKTNVIEVD